MALLITTPLQLLLANIYFFHSLSHSCQCRGDTLGSTGREKERVLLYCNEFVQLATKLTRSLPVQSCTAVCPIKHVLYGRLLSKRWSSTACKANLSILDRYCNSLCRKSVYVQKRSPKLFYGPEQNLTKRQCRKSPYCRVILSITDTHCCEIITYQTNMGTWFKSFQESSGIFKF